MFPQQQERPRLTAGYEQLALQTSDLWNSPQAPQRGLGHQRHQHSKGEDFPKLCG